MMNKLFILGTCLALIGCSESDVNLQGVPSSVVSYELMRVDGVAYLKTSYKLSVMFNVDSTVKTCTIKDNKAILD